MARFKLLLALTIDAFRFIKRYRERQLAARVHAVNERDKERRHQLLMLEAIGSKLIALAQTNQEGVLKLAEAQAATADALQSWIKGFQVPSDASMAPSTVREEDEWQMEQERLAEHDPAAFIAGLPPEFALALSMQKLDQDPNPGFDREGRDPLNG